MQDQKCTPLTETCRATLANSLPPGFRDFVANAAILGAILGGSIGLCATGIFFALSGLALDGPAWNPSLIQELLICLYLLALGAGIGAAVLAIPTVFLLAVWTVLRANRINESWGLWWLRLGIVLVLLTGFIFMVLVLMRRVGN
jgi:hypothetical protein